MARHRYSYEHYKEGYKRIFTSSFEMFDEYGPENCKIELLENICCDSKEELMKLEGFYIQNNDCINKRIAGRTKTEWVEDNKKYVKEWFQQYHEENKDERNLKKKQYRENNPELIKEQSKKSRDKRKEKIQERRSEKHICDCGGRYTHHHIRTHERSNQHQDYLKSLQQD